MSSRCGGGRALALDLGLRRIGVALSDPLRVTARPLCTLRRQSRSADLERIRQLVAELKVAVVVVGWPLMPSGERGVRARWAEAFASALRKLLDVPVVLWDESYTTETAQARRRDRAAGRHRSQPAELDAEAAAVILEEWLAAANESAEHAF